MSDLVNLKNKRLAGIDYGKRRIGISVCDIFHITVTPKKTFDNSESIIDEIKQFAIAEHIDALIVGVPYRNDDRNKDFIDEILLFIKKLKEITGLDVYKQDESYSTKEAVHTMIDIGYNKKKRRKKGNKDKIASAIILRSFLNSIE